MNIEGNSGGNKKINNGKYGYNKLFHLPGKGIQNTTAVAGKALFNINPATKFYINLQSSI